jgi:hypothetical protein
LRDSVNGIGRERDHIIAATIELLRTHVAEVDAVKELAHAS